MICLPSLLSRRPVMIPDLRIEVTSQELLDETGILSNCMEYRRDPSTQALSDNGTNVQ